MDVQCVKKSPDQWGDVKCFREVKAKSRGKKVNEGGGEKRETRRVIDDRWGCASSSSLSANLSVESVEPRWSCVFRCTYISKIEAQNTACRRRRRSTLHALRS